MFNKLRSIPFLTIFYLMVTWAFLTLLNYGLKGIGLYDNVPSKFPISVFSGPSIHFSGIPYLLLFLFLIAVAINYAEKLNIYQIWLTGFLLIILGNLGQGSFDLAFLKPFYGTGYEYYYYAMEITDWQGWLKSFNSTQESLLVHAGTHPPFAVLIHYPILKWSHGSITVLSMSFVFISSLSIILFWNILRILRVDPEKRNLLALIFSAIPAMNIYCGVCLDGLILTSTTMFLLGTVLILDAPRRFFPGLLLFAGGIIITNLLTFGGVFLIAVAGLLAIRELLLHRRIKLAASLLISILIFSAIALSLYLNHGYNHALGFLSASAIENPDGFRGWHEPLRYLATRVECVSEIALFLSLGFLATLFHPSKLNITPSDLRNPPLYISFAGLTVLLLMLISGAYHTGETARAAIFIYPYILLLFINTDIVLLKQLSILAGIQTALMQLLGKYLW